MHDFLNPEPGESLARFAARCKKALTPGIVGATPFTDDRGWSFMGLMIGVLDGGQINYSTQYAGVVKAWHRHALQTDFWFVLHGMMKLGVMEHEGPRRWSVEIGQRRPATVIIPPTLWHGAKALGAQDAGLLYYVDRVYQIDKPDEERRPHDWQWNPWDTVPR